MGLVVSPRIQGLGGPWGLGDPERTYILGVMGLKILSRPTVLNGLSRFLVILYNAPILKFSRAIYFNIHVVINDVISACAKVVIERCGLHPRP